MPNAYIEHTNHYATIQDKGRFGFKHLGVGASGPADLLAFAVANQILGNPSNTSVIETVLGNLTLRFDTDTRICVTGADTPLKLNGAPAPTWSSINIRKNDLLELGFPKQGNYNYLSVSGGFSVARLLGSSATNVRDALGPFDGKALTPKLNLRYPSCALEALGSNRSYPKPQVPEYQSELRLRFIPSDHFTSLDDKIRMHLLSEAYEISSKTNKMGARLRGYPIELPQAQHAFSRAVCTGAIQVLPSGQPVVLLTDHQTIGGYPILGSVYLFDCSSLAQRRPGQKVYFEEGTLDAAQRSAHKFLSGMDL